MIKFFHITQVSWTYNLFSSSVKKSFLPLLHGASFFFSLPLHSLLLYLFFYAHLSIARCFSLIAVLLSSLPPLLTILNSALVLPIWKFYCEEDAVKLEFIQVNVYLMKCTICCHMFGLSQRSRCFKFSLLFMSPLFVHRAIPKGLCHDEVPLNILKKNLKKNTKRTSKQIKSVHKWRRRLNFNKSRSKKAWKDNVEKVHFQAGKEIH